jgi:peptidoglycan biosynthesis protein MviN/MurJ (putative lipid II flippase)
MTRYRQPALVGAISLATIVLSFLMTRYVLRSLGAGVATDALFAGTTIPQLFFEVITYSLSLVVLPLLCVEDPEQRRRDTWTLAQSVGAVFLIVAALLWFATPLWVPWLVRGFPPAGQALTVSLARIQLIGMVFSSVTGVLSCYQYSLNRFARTELCSALAAGLALSFLMVMLPVTGIAAGAWSFVLRSVVEMLLLGIGLGRYHAPDFRSFVARQTSRRVGPLLLSSAYSRSAPAIDRYLASLAPAGSLTLLNLGRQMQDAMTRVLNKAITNPILPTLARCARNGDRKLFDQAYKQRLRWVAAATSLMLAGVLVGGRPALILVLGDGRVSESDLTVLWEIMLALAGVQMGFGMRNILAGAFYAMGDTRTPTRIDAICYTVGIPLRILGFHWFGIVGIAAGTSAFYILDGVMLQAALNRARFAPAPDEWRTEEVQRA